MDCKSTIIFIKKTTYQQYFSFALNLLTNRRVNPYFMRGAILQYLSEKNNPKSQSQIKIMHFYI